MTYNRISGYVADRHRKLQKTSKARSSAFRTSVGQNTRYVMPRAAAGRCHEAANCRTRRELSTSASEGCRRIQSVAEVDKKPRVFDLTLERSEGNLYPIAAATRLEYRLTLERAPWRCWPVTWTPCKANTFLARPNPRVTILMDFPFDELMRLRTSRRGTSSPVVATRLVRDGEVPFIG